MNLELQRRYRRLFRFYYWVVNEQAFVDSHEEVVSAFARLAVQARIFIAKAAVGFLDCLNLNRDGVLELAMARAEGEGSVASAIQCAARMNVAGLDDLYDPPVSASFLA